VSAPRGSVTLTAGRDIQLGTIGSDFNNDVISNNTLTMIAGRDILIDGFAAPDDTTHGTETEFYIYYDDNSHVIVSDLSAPYQP